MVNSVSRTDDHFSETSPALDLKSPSHCEAPRKPLPARAPTFKANPTSKWRHSIINLTTTPRTPKRKIKVSTPKTPKHICRLTTKPRRPELCCLHAHARSAEYPHVRSFFLTEISCCAPFPSLQARQNLLLPIQSSQTTATALEICHRHLL